MSDPRHGGEPLTRRETIKALSALGIGTGLLAERTSAADHGEKPSGNKTIAEPARQIPVYADADVVVCGGGPIRLARRWDWARATPVTRSWSRERPMCWAPWFVLPSPTRN